jgi:spore coat polysaccharide biosynthesis protein SpsF (cytidylyltransferase family)
MAFSEHERYRFEKTVKTYIESRRPPPHIRPELDLGYRIVGQSVEVFEVRPAFQRPDEIIEHGIARATYVKSRNVWKVFWLRADLKWHRYEPVATVATIDDFIGVIDEDPHGCFFG